MRIWFLGDSFVEGIGDPRGEGWAGRLAERTAGGRLDPVNLGVRGQTTVEIADRLDEMWRMLDDDSAAASSRGRGLVCSFGTNDCVPVDGFDLETAEPRVSPEASLAAAARVFALAERLPVLFVIPPPVRSEAINRRMDALTQSMKAECSRRDVATVDPRFALRHDPGYLDTLADGAHPSGAGYERLADLIEPEWHRFLRALT